VVLMNFILTALIVSVAIQLILFIPAYIRRTDKLTDFSYGFSFIVLAIFALFSANTSIGKMLLATMITIWGMRLIIYLVIRVIKSRKDKRFDGIREKFWKFFSFWFLQGISVWIIMLPSLLLMSKYDAPITQLSMLGLFIWIFGILTEGIADFQKSKFKADPANKDKWIATGLWKYSRHPNYFGEMLCWIGIYIYCLPTLMAAGLEWLIALISPLYIMTILLFITGLPKLEKYADDKWGKDKAYQDYKRQTSAIILLPRKRQ
jgi:steroid 5-alpha reductase family enzyme